LAITSPDQSQGLTIPSLILHRPWKASDVPVPKKASVPFSSSPSAVQANAELLAKYNFDLERLLGFESSTTVDYGSEFRPLPQLE
jgi:hypothetical protein